MENRKNIILAFVVAVIIIAIAYLSVQNPTRTDMSDVISVKPSVNSMNKEEKAKRYELAKEITSPNGFINTSLNPDGSAKPITISELVGKKVVMLDIWTYSCINCERTLPYLNAWYEKYKDQGLEIIGLHTPEFEFEKEYKNILDAVKKYDVRYPVVLDNDFSTWNAYGNRYWPRKYLIDIDGYVVYDHIGEGGYEETEKKIQELLTERALVLKTNEAITSDVAHPVGAIDGSKLEVGSPETYFGAFRNQYLANGKQGVVGGQTLSFPQKIEVNALYLSGAWYIQNEYAESKGEVAKIQFRYRAKDVYIVASSEAGATIQVLRDGVPVKAEAGADVAQDGSGEVIVQQEGLYKLIQDPEGTNEHTIEIIIKKGELKAFAFTFG